MLYQKRMKRAMDLLQEKNKSLSGNDTEIKTASVIQEEFSEDRANGKEEMNQVDESSFNKEEQRETEISLEKNDRMALFLSALVVFLPFALIIGVIGAILIFLITLI